MRIRIGYNLAFNCSQPTPMLLALNVHESRQSDIVVPDQLTTEPAIPVQQYRDQFGNLCSRLLAPTGRLEIKAEGIVEDNGQPDPVAPHACQHLVEDLPEDTLNFLLGSRYCETDLLTNIAWNLFGNTAPGWPRVQAIVDFVHHHITFGYGYARTTKSAWEVYNERVGVCRDFAHLAIAFCRCMNIPARYCTGYLGDIGLPPPYAPMDFAAWFEAYLGGTWYTFDPRNYVPRIGRVLIARGRDASDVAITMAFGSAALEKFEVSTDEIADDMAVSVGA